MRILLDTNIYLDLLQHRIPFQTETLELLKLDNDYGITATTITDLVYLTRKTPNIFELLQIFLDPFTIFTVNAEVIQRAFNSKITDFEDAVQEQSALLNGAVAIITRNKKDFVNSILPVYTPTEWLNKG